MGDLKWKIVLLLLIGGAVYAVRKHGLDDLLDVGGGDPSLVRTEIELLRTDGTIVVAVVDVIGVGDITSGATVECALNHPTGVFAKKKKTYYGALGFGQLERLEFKYQTGHATAAVPGDSRRVRVESWGGEAYVTCEVLSAR